VTPGEWISEHVEPTGAIELATDEPWSTVLRVPVEGDVVWFKHCKGKWAFEPYLTAALASRWPDSVPTVVAHDPSRAWLLTRHAGSHIDGAHPIWPEAVRRYAELQQGEAAHADAHVAAGVPDLRLARLPEEYARLLVRVPDERLRRFERRFADLCEELAARGVPETIQHDDLHQYNVYLRDDAPLILDWGDSSVAHPYFSLVATLRHIDDDLHEPVRRAFLDAWGGNDATLTLALRVGRIAHAFATPPELESDEDWPRVLALAVAQTDE
jgi:hypothetical protein